MACRSVNSLRLSKDDMRRVYRDQARNRRGGVKIGHIIKILDILLPIIPQFFGSNHANADSYNRCSVGCDGEDFMSYHSSRLGGFGRASDHDANDSGRYGHSHGMTYGNAHYGMACADDYADRVISEEEFESLLDFAEQRYGKIF